MSRDSIIAVFLMLIVLTPVICASVFAWKEYTNAYELAENLLDALIVTRIPKDAGLLRVAPGADSGKPLPIPWIIESPGT